MNTTCLRGLSIVVIISLLNIACKKSNDNPRVDPVNYTKLKVLESETNIPVANASIELYECTLQGLGGCAQNSLVGTATTDKDGSFLFDSKLAPYLIIASHNNYWEGTTGGDSNGLGDIYLIPVAYTRIHLKKMDVHPADLFLVISLNHSPAFYQGLVNSYNQVSDSTVIIESYGNSDNTIAWYFTDNNGTTVTSETGGQLPDYHINRFDTAFVEINY